MSVKMSLSSQIGSCNWILHMPKTVTPQWLGSSDGWYCFVVAFAATLIDHPELSRGTVTKL